MAIDKPISPTNDPGYLGYSQGTDRATLQPLATVPDLNTKYVQPDWATNRSTGKAIEGVGELLSAGIKLTDAVIEKKAGDAVKAGVNEIRDSFGVKAGADIASGLATAVGRAGAEGVSLTEPDKNAGVPLAINRMGNRIQGLQEAYRQGELSNSAYYGKLEARVSQIKAQFPGYEDVIDQKVSTIVGTTPANALRQSMLQDVAELQKKVQQSVDKRTAWEQQNANYIYSTWPNYEADKAAGKAPSWEAVQQKVGQLKAREWSDTAVTARLALLKAGDEGRGRDAESISIKRLADNADSVVLATTNTMGIKNGSDLQTLINDVNSGKRQPLTADEKTQLTGIFAQMNQQYKVNAEKILNEPIAEGSTETLKSIIRNPTKIADITEQGRANLKTMQDGILDEKFGLVASTANWVKATSDAADGDFLRKAPTMATVASGRKFMGDQGLSMLMIQQPLLQSHVMEAFRAVGIGAVASGNSSLRQTLDMFKENGQMDSTLWRTHINDAANTIIHSDKVEDKSAAKKAVNHLFGPDNRILMEAWQHEPGSQVWLFNNLTRKAVVDKIKTMDGESKSTFVNFANEGFTSVYQTTANGANQTATNYGKNNNLKLEYNENGTFSFSGSRATPAVVVQQANAKLAPMNSAIASMSEVWKMQGKPVTDALYELLPVVGITPGTPMYNVLQKKYNELNPPENPR